MPNERDTAAEVLGLPDIVISFRETWPEDVQILSRLMFAKNIDYTKLHHDLFQHQGEYEWLRVRERSFSVNTSRQWSKADGVGVSEQESETESEQETEQTTWAKAKTRQATTGNSHAEGGGTTSSGSKSIHDSPVIVGGEVKKTLKIGAAQDGASDQASWTKTVSDSVTEGDTDTKGGGQSKARGKAKAKAKGTQRNETTTKGGGESESLTISEKLVAQPKLVHVKQDTGQLQRTVNDQYEEFGSELSSLDRREFFARVGGGKAVKVVTDEVKDPFTSPAAQMKAVEWFKRRLYETHDYYFTPSAEEDKPAEGGADEPLMLEHDAECETKEDSVTIEKEERKYL